MERAERGGGSYKRSAEDWEHERRIPIEWRKESLYKADADFIFPSIRLNGTAPRMPELALKKEHPTCFIVLDKRGTR